MMNVFREDIFKVYLFAFQFKFGAKCGKRETYKKRQPIKSMQIQAINLS